MNKLSSCWNEVTTEYKIKQIIGEGSYGQVVKARHRETKQIVAIKKIDCDFGMASELQYLASEVTIMRQLTEMDDNIFTPKLLDVIIPKKNAENIILTKEVFLVMEILNVDYKDVLQNACQDPIGGSPLKIIFYNMLCCLNFIHSANIMHRDIKPANFLSTE